MKKLTTRLSICVGGGLVVTLIVTTVLVMRSKESILMKNLGYMSSNLAVNLSTACVDPLLAGDYGYLEKYVRKVAQENPQISYIRVWAAREGDNVQVVARFAPPEPFSEPGNDYLTFRKPILLEADDMPSETLGELEIGVSTANIGRFVDLSTWQFMPGCVIAFALLAIVINLVLKRSVLDPIRTLGVHAERISRGQLDTPIEVPGNDELERFARTMESLRVNLRESYDRVEQKIDELKESRERFKELLESAPDAMLIANGSGEIVLVNSGAERMFGYSREQLLGETVKTFLPEPLIRRIGDALEYTAQSKSGRKFLVSITVNPLKLEKKFFYAFSIRDAEERNRLEENLRRSKRSAELANQAKSEFLANMSHEIRTPLHGILSFAGFGIKKHATAGAEKLLDYFQKIQESGMTLLRLLDNLLDLAKLESGKTIFDFQPVDLPSLLRAVAGEFDTRASERKLSVQCPELAFKADATVDAGKIKQVVRNLLSNAVKFSPPGGVIRINLRQQADSVAISVVDQGPGIPEDELETVFDKFVQSSKTRTGAGGTGLGLAICREIVAAHQGRIWVENNRDGGSLFSFEIPVSMTIKEEQENEYSAQTT